MHTRNTKPFFGRALAAIAILPWSLLLQFESHAADTQLTPAQRDWNAVSALTKVVPAKRDPGPRLSATASASLAQQHTERARQASAAAKAFHEKYPSDAKVAEAKKVEAVMALRGIRAADSEQRGRALGLANAFRDNATHPKADRLSVAFEYESALLTEKIRTKAVQPTPAEWVKLVDQLRLEFGDLPEVAERYVEFTRYADTATAKSAAQKALQIPLADRNVKAEAQSVIDRANLIGAKFSFRLTGGAAPDYDFQQARPRPTLVVAWSSTAPDSLKSLEEFRRNITVWADVVYVQLGGSRMNSKVTEALPVAGTHLHVSSAAAVKSTLTGLKLRYAPIPYVYLLGADGTVLGHGRIVEIPKLLKVFEATQSKK